MSKGRKSHHWDLFAPLIYVTANQWCKKKDQIKLEKIHPFLKEKQIKKEKVKSVKDWLHGNN